MPKRYAIYFTPTGALGTAGAGWLGWDIARGAEVPQPRLDGLSLTNLTDKPRRYGFHATIKPPFRLKSSWHEADLRVAFRALCADLKPVPFPELCITPLGRFLALTLPRDADPTVKPLAAKVVEKLDTFRAPLDKIEVERRDRPHFTPRQKTNLLRYGYPLVMEDFRFHITLTDRTSDLKPAIRAASDWFDASLAQPLDLSHLSLVGEGADGFFRVLERNALKG